MPINSIENNKCEIMCAINVIYLSVSKWFCKKKNFQNKCNENSIQIKKKTIWSTIKQCSIAYVISQNKMLILKNTLFTFLIKHNYKVGSEF